MIAESIAISTDGSAVVTPVRHAAPFQVSRPRTTTQNARSAIMGESSTVAHIGLSNPSRMVLVGVFLAFTYCFTGCMGTVPPFLSPGEMLQQQHVSNIDGINHNRTSLRTTVETALDSPSKTKWRQKGNKSRGLSLETLLSKDNILDRSWYEEQEEEQAHRVEGNENDILVGASKPQNVNPGEVGLSEVTTVYRSVDNGEGAAMIDRNEDFFPLNSSLDIATNSDPKLNDTLEVDVPPHIDRSDTLTANKLSTIQEKNDNTNDIKGHFLISPFNIPSSSLSSPKIHTLQHEGYEETMVTSSQSSSQPQGTQALQRDSPVVIQPEVLSGVNVHNAEKRDAVESIRIFKDAQTFIKLKRGTQNDVQKFSESSDTTKMNQEMDSELTKPHKPVDSVQSLVQDVVTRLTASLQRLFQKELETNPHPLEGVDTSKSHNISDTFSWKDLASDEMINSLVHSGATLDVLDQEDDFNEFLDHLRQYYNDHASYVVLHAVETKTIPDDLEFWMNVSKFLDTPHTYLRRTKRRAGRWRSRRYRNYQARLRRQRIRARIIYSHIVPCAYRDRYFCLNQGTCVFVKALKIKTCRCPIRYKGVRCELLNEEYMFTLLTNQLI